LQLLHFRFQIFVRDDQRFHSIANIAAARRNGLIRSCLKLIRVRLWIGRGAGRHERVPA
jgi:hypothetical protein